MRKKSKFNNPNKNEPLQQVTDTPSIKKVSQGGFFVANNAVNVQNNYGMVLYGDNQKYSGAPLKVPNGFVTGIPYRSGINSTIIQNPSPIPLHTYWTLTTSEPVSSSNMLYWVTLIVARIGQFTSKNKEYEKHVRKALKNVGFIKLKKSLAASVYMGVSVVKINWGIDADTNLTIPESILYLPPESLMLAVTPTGGLDSKFGVMQRYYGPNQYQQQPQGYGSQGAAPLASLGTSMIPQRQVGVNLTFVSALPESWYIIHTFNPFGDNSNHWGYSFHQASYNSVCEKYNYMQKVQIAASYKSAPLVMIETDSESTVEYSPGQFEPLFTSMKKQFATMAGTGFGFVDGLGSIKVTTIDNTADLQKMWIPIDNCDDQIRIAHCVPNLVGDSGSFAGKKVNSDTHKNLANSIALQFIDTLKTQFSNRVIYAAYGDDVPEDELGDFELLDNSLDDQIMWAKLFLDARNTGLLDPSNLEQVNFALHKMGMPPVDKVSEDVLMGIFDPSKEPANVGAAKQAMGEPYAKGIDKHEDKFK